MKKILIYIFGFIFLVQGVGISQASFSDVSPTHRYSEDIQYIEQFGIVEGSIFKPNSLITRGDFAKWILKNTGFKTEGYKPKTKKTFADVKMGKDANAPYIYKLVDLGVLEIGNDTASYFKPTSTITRKEALAWIFNIEGISVPKVFNELDYKATDVSVDSAIAPLIHRAISLGILKPGKTRLVTKITRGEAAHFLKTVKSATPNLTVTIMPSIESDMITNPQFDVMTGVWNKVLQSYLKRTDVNRDALIYGAIEGMVQELGDKHSNFERPGNNALIESLSGEIEGIGAVIQMQEEQVVVVSPIVGSPAEKAGVMADDIITAVDDVNIKGMKLTDVVARIKGKRGTQVKITILRGTQVVNLNITRDVVKIISVSIKRTSDNIAQVVLSSFGENTEAEFRRVVDDIANKAPKGIIIDLRNNPGGFLNTAITLAGYFINKGDKVAGVKYPDHEDSYNAVGTAELAKYKIMILVNKGSASASEILAGALQDYGLATVIGDQTYGKGTVQELSDFNDGSVLKITVAEWLTPKGRSIEKNGITPDIIVKITDEERKAGKDPQMDRALAELRR